MSGLSDKKKIGFFASQLHFANHRARRVKAIWNRNFYQEIYKRSEKMQGKKNSDLPQSDNQNKISDWLIFVTKKEHKICLKHREA